MAHKVPTILCEYLVSPLWPAQSLTSKNLISAKIANIIIPEIASCQGI